LGISRFVPYKKLQLVIDFGRVNGVPVVLCGAGPQETSLRKYATETGASVQFVVAPSRQLLRAILQRAKCLVFPGIEDFGIVPVEAMAAGVPVVGINNGGVAETVEHGVSGFLCEDFSAGEMRDAYSAVQGLVRASLIERSTKFTVDSFRSSFKDWLKSSLNYDPFPNKGLVQ
jgi:glycosyltransferase involved in cell wall biosynthesis